MTRLRTAALLLGVTLLAACEKGGPQEILGTLPGARVRFFHFGLNAPNVNFYAGETKLTAISATGCTPPTNPACTSTGLESTIGTAYGAAGSSGLYSAIEPGQYVLSGRIAAATDKDFTIARVTQSLDAGKAYSFYLSGPYNTATKSSDAFVLEDAFPAEPDYNVVTIRFVNAIANSQPMQLLIKSATRGTETPVGAAVPYKGATAFVTLNANDVNIWGQNEGSWELVVRAPGGTSVHFNRTGVGFGRGRVYTVAARGDMTVTGTTAVTRPLLDVTVHR